MEAVRAVADMTRSPMFFLLLLIATALFSAFIVDAGIHLWNVFNNALTGAVNSINTGGVTATYTEPSINPRWAADQIAGPLTAVLWILVAALIILIIYAYREHDED